MKIEKIQVLNDSNVLNTNSNKVILMKVDIGNLETKSTNAIDGFSDRLKTLMPSLYTYKNSEGTQGKFFQSVDSGISITNIINSIATELQCLAGMKTELGTIEQTDTKGVYNFTFNCVDEDAGMYAALASVEIVEALVNGKLYFIRHDIDRLKCLYHQNQAALATIKVAENVPYFKLNKQTVQWESGVKQQHKIKFNIPLLRVI